MTSSLTIMVLSLKFSKDHAQTVSQEGQNYDHTFSDSVITHNDKTDNRLPFYL